MKQTFYKHINRHHSVNWIDKIVQLIVGNKKVTIARLSLRCEVSDKTFKRNISKLKEQGRVKRVGSLKSGSWEVVS